MGAPSEWIAARGLRPVSADPSELGIPDHVLNDVELSLAAKGLFALLVASQGQPIDPFDDALEDNADISAAIDELLGAGLAVRVAR
ncbi:hypothetical protein ACFPJ2_08445 [Microbacterium suwonense]|uniref:Uncharacterized protein n=1 Tax=Microbacterium suwonense TaxID=683047 RepID=A0ABN6X3P6_9MICO|nr:hypothetical protein GCM10025863_19650 [Microbacterium suwonense]